MRKRKSCTFTKKIWDIEHHFNFYLFFLQFLGVLSKYWNHVKMLKLSQYGDKTVLLTDLDRICVNCIVYHGPFFYLINGLRFWSSIATFGPFHSSSSLSQLLPRSLRRFTQLHLGITLPLISEATEDFTMQSSFDLGMSLRQTSANRN